MSRLFALVGGVEAEGVLELEADPREGGGGGRGGDQLLVHGGARAQRVRVGDREGRHQDFAARPDWRPSRWPPDRCRCRRGPPSSRPGCRRRRSRRRAAGFDPAEPPAEDLAARMALAAIRADAGQLEHHLAGAGAGLDGEAQGLLGLACARRGDSAEGGHAVEQLQRHRARTAFDRRAHRGRVAGAGAVAQHRPHAPGLAGVEEGVAVAGNLGEHRGFDLQLDPAVQVNGEIAG